MKILNRQNQKQQRVDLRNAATTSERILWQKIRNKQLGYKFRRQHGIGSYIIDFYCPELKLAIEIDGACHETEEEVGRDLEKQRFVENYKIKVIRYLNVDVKDNIEAVVSNLLEVCKRREAEVKI